MQNYRLALTRINGHLCGAHGHLSREGGGQRPRQPHPDAPVGQGFDEVEHPSLHTDAVDAAIPKVVRNVVGLSGQCPACSIVMLCASELDGDATAEVWTVSTLERLGGNGEKIVGGMPWLESDDVMQ